MDDTVFIFWQSVFVPAHFTLMIDMCNHGIYYIENLGLPPQNLISQPTMPQLQSEINEINIYLITIHLPNRYYILSYYVVPLTVIC